MKCVGFVKNKEQRNQQLPFYREKIREAIERDLIEDTNVVAIFYGGSIGTEETDLFSDIDLRIVVKDELFEQYRRNKKIRASYWGDVLFFEDVSWANYSSAHFRNFVKVDSFYYKVSDIKPSMWLQKIKIVKDSDAFLKRIVEQSQLLSYQPTLSELEHWQTKFYAHLHEAYRRTMRDEQFYALHCMDYLRLSVVAGWYMEKGIQPNSSGDWAKIEGERSKLSSEQLSMLAIWHCNRDQNEILRVMRSITSQFLSVQSKVCAKYGIDEDLKLTKEILDLVM